MKPTALRSLFLLLSLGCAACAQVPSSNAPASAPVATTHPAGHADAAIEVQPLPPDSDRQRQDETFGLHFESLRVSGDGLLLDFRYRVTDPDKAMHVVNRQTRPVIIDPVSKMELQVPHAQNIGTLRQMGSKLIRGRRYTALFANPGKIIKSGSKVSIVMGSFRLDNVVVE